MPLNKSSRGHRLDPTMISAPMGDFRHTMHIGRGGDAFGDTSFLTTVGPSATPPEVGSPGKLLPTDTVVTVNNGNLQTDAADGAEEGQLRHSDSVSSFTLDLDLDLGPSMLGDVLGVMDGLALNANEEDTFAQQSGNKQSKGGLNTHNELNGNGLDGPQARDGNFKAKGYRPKVRFSDKREEIIRQPSEEDEGQSFELPGDDQTEICRPASAEIELANHKAEFPPSPASSHSSEYEGDTQLDRRRPESHSETDSDEEDEGEGRGYTFEDESDEEIGL